MNTQQSTILIVEDSQENRTILDGLCKSLKYNTVLAVNGKDALQKISSFNLTFQLVLLDIEMPEMNGFEFLQKFKSNPAWKEIPVLMVTSLDDVESVLECFHKGADDYITKPFEPEILKARLENSLSKYTLHRLEKELLDKTFGGSIKILSEILSTLSPELFGRSNRTRRVAKLLCEELNYGNPWEVEMAALFSLIGCIALPDDILNKVVQGKTLIADEKVLFDKHPIIGYKLISQIPRLEKVAQILLFQNIVNMSQMSILPSELLRKYSVIPYGASILNAAIEYDNARMKANRKEDMIKYLNSKEISVEIFRGIEKVIFIENGKEIKHVNVTDLEVGMIFAEEIFSLNESKVGSKWMEISASIIERMNQIHERIGVKQPIPVYINKIKP
jgi:CheY-like chemotaxis protein